MRYALIVLLMLFGLLTSAVAQVSINIGLPGVNIGINLPLYPKLERVPGYPVYYAPRMNSNYFFYDGMYWVYQQDRWYASSWYNGPWGLVEPWYVPVYVLRIPVRYYRDRPEYFRGWQQDAPPRWGEHWGNDWEQQRRGWDQWDRRSAPAPAPLPVYQRNYSGDRYPRLEQQRELHSQNYHYQPRDPVVRQHYQEQAAQRAPTPSRQEQQKAPQERSPKPQDRQESQRANPPPAQQSAPPRAQPQQREREDMQKSAPSQAPQQKGREDVQRSAPPQAPAQQKGPAAQDQRQQSPQGKGASQESNRGQEQQKDRGNSEDKGQERNR
jgi:hypothetical protein